MPKSSIPKSLRIFLRREKARIRREVLDSVEVDKRIKEVVEKTFRQYNKIEKETSRDTKAAS